MATRKPREPRKADPTRKSLGVLSGLSGTEWKVLLTSVKLVDVMKYAVAVVGLAAAYGLSSLFLRGNNLAIAAGTVLALMVLVLLVRHIAKYLPRDSFTLPGKIIVWSVALIAVAALAFGFYVVARGYLPDVAPTTTSLLLQSDAPCNLTVDGGNKGILPGGATQSFVTVPGDHALDCLSIDVPSIHVAKTESVQPNHQTLVSFDIKAQVDKAKAAAAEAALNEEKARHEKQSALSGGLYEESENVLVDTRTGLRWAKKDNGYRIQWPYALAYCPTLGQGWRLPMVKELEGLYDTTGMIAHANCNSYEDAAICKVPQLFELSNVFFWTQERGDASDRLVVNLSDFRHLSLRPETNVYERALCVKGEIKVPPFDWLQYKQENGNG